MGYSLVINRSRGIIIDQLKREFKYLHLIKSNYSLAVGGDFVPTINDYKASDTIQFIEAQLASGNSTYKVINNFNNIVKGSGTTLAGIEKIPNFFVKANTPTNKIFITKTVPLGTLESTELLAIIPITEINSPKDASLFVNNLEIKVGWLYEKRSRVGN